MSNATILITAEQFDEMTFDSPVELVRGEIVEMTRPGGWHGKVCSNLAYHLHGWARNEEKYDVLLNDTGVLTTRDPDTLRGPDLFVVRRDRLPEGQLPKGSFSVAPDVCIEVRSPNDRWTDILGKVGEYLDAGVVEV